MGGGRPPQKLNTSETELIKTIEEYNKRNISCHFTFSNYNITKDLLGDLNGNLVLKALSKLDFDNGIIVSCDLLSDYIKEKYPQIKQISSVIRPHYEYPNYDESPEYYNSLCERFDKVCIRPEFNTNEKFLKKLKYKNKIELMVNQLCFKKCPIAKTHYDRSVMQSINDIEIYKRIHFCDKKSQDIKTIDQRMNNSNEQITRLIKLGFNNLKLKGRGASPQTLLSSLIGRYVFDPTGYFPAIEDYLLNKSELV